MAVGILAQLVWRYKVAGRWRRERRGERGTKAKERERRRSVNEK